MFILLQVVPPAEDRDADDDDVAEDAEPVRQFAPGEEAPDRGEEDLDVVEDGDLLGRRVGICCRDAELAARSADTGEEQHGGLPERHGAVVDDEVRRGAEQRERGEREDDEHAPLPLLREFPHVRVRGARAEPGAEADEGRQARDARGGLDDEQRADEGDEDRHPLHPVRPFLQDEVRHDDGEEGAHLV